MACRLSKSLRRLGLNERGVAAVEFALILPLLITLYLGSVDLSQGIMADRKLTSVAGALGDLVAQAREGGLSRTTLEDYFSASTAIMRPFRGEETAMRVALVQVDAYGATRTIWSETRNGAPGTPVGQPFALPSQITSVARDSYVVVSDAWYSYRPVIGYVIDAPIPLHKQFFHIPRSGERIDLRS